MSSLLLRSSRDDDSNDGCLEEDRLGDDDDKEDREKRRMEMVRKLQKSFYQTPSTEKNNNDDDDGAASRSNRRRGVTEPTLENGGALQNVPLWRVQWTELPGRSNVLSVHEPMYTNMFEEMIRNSDEWYFGHLYLPGGSKNLRSTQPSLKLKTWKDELDAGEAQSPGLSDSSSSSNTNDDQSAPSLGTLMKITDYRRMEDGKLLLLVQAVERFVVTEIVQELPYGIANMQLLPDREEIQLPSTNTKKKETENTGELKTRADGSSSSSSRQKPILYTESMVQQARALALVESWKKWFPYEFEASNFPLPQVENMAACEVVGSALAKVLPYVPFDLHKLPTEDLIPPNMQESDKTTCTEQQSVKAATTTAMMMEEEEDDDDDKSPKKPLEVRLLEGGILKEAGVPDSLLRMPLAELEVNLWLALNDFLKSSRTPVSPVLLGLLPPSVGSKTNWPSDFVLESIADAIDHNYAGVLEHKYVRVSAVYPAIRRQKRLSYYAAALLERNPDRVNELRQMLLQIPR